MERELARLKAENARLLRLLEMTPQQAKPAAATQTGLFLQRPGPVSASSSGSDKVRFFRTLFAARPDIYATRWENTRNGKSGWVPAVAGGWRKGSNRPYLPMGDDVVTPHLTGDIHVGLYPLLDGDRCCWLAADFDGPAAMLDALSYLKAARALGVPGALEVSRSGVGAHVWIFFTGPVPAAIARTRWSRTMTNGRTCPAWAGSPPRRSSGSPPEPPESMSAPPWTGSRWRPRRVRGRAPRQWCRPSWARASASTPHN
jgi:hypothetical protein